MLSLCFSLFFSLSLFMGSRLCSPVRQWYRCNRHLLHCRLLLCSDCCRLLLLLLTGEVHSGALANAQFGSLLVVLVVAAVKTTTLSHCTVIETQPTTQSATIIGNCHGTGRQLRRQRRRRRRTPQAPSPPRPPPPALLQLLVTT